LGDLSERYEEVASLIFGILTQDSKNILPYNEETDDGNFF